MTWLARPSLARAAQPACPRAVIGDVDEQRRVGIAEGQTDDLLDLGDDDGLVGVADRIKSPTVEAIRDLHAEGLRIADASIMPRITTGNTMAPCVVIGERAADVIKAQYGI